MCVNGLPYTHTLSPKAQLIRDQAIWQNQLKLHMLVVTKTSPRSLAQPQRQDQRHVRIKITASSETELNDERSQAVAVILFCFSSPVRRCVIREQREHVSDTPPNPPIYG